jgi:MFS superfamily sulfate permease-like transporter
MNRKSATTVKQLSSDISASIVVFLVALPLCLGIALASNPAGQTIVPILSGVIAGIVGGIVIGFISKSPLSISGPAAGLTAIVAGALGELPSYEVFLLSVIIAGLLQVAFGFLKAGLLGDFIPNSVIKGMLAAIGLILILKQIPHFLGFDADYEGDESFFQADKKNTFTEIINAIQNPNGGAVLIAGICLLLLIVLELKAVKKWKLFQFVPGPLLVVIAGVLINNYFTTHGSTLALKDNHLVALPVLNHPSEIIAVLPSPDWGSILNIKVWLIAFTLAVVASLETLLSIEAVDKLDPQKRLTPNNHELKTQGIGNIISGFLGGLPITSVIVRSSANVNAGGKTKLSAIFHGILLLAATLFFPKWINYIPLSALSAILIFTGYKLAKVSLFKEYYQKGWDQFLPFIITVIAIIFTDLLKGIGIGVIAGFFFVLRSNFKTAVFVIKDEEDRYLIRFRKEVSFMNKVFVKNSFEKIPDNTAVLIDATHSDFIDKDIIEIVNDFIVNAGTRNIRVYIKRRQGDDREIFIDPEKRVTE